MASEHGVNHKTAEQRKKADQNRYTHTSPAVICFAFSLSPSFRLPDFSGKSDPLEGSLK